MGEKPGGINFAWDASAHINTVAFFKKLEESGINSVPYFANTQTNKENISRRLTEIFDFAKKSKHFDSTGELIFSNNDLKMISMVEYFMIASDPDFAAIKADLEALRIDNLREVVCKVRN